MKNKILFFISMLACGLLGAGLDIAIRPTDEGIIVDASYTIKLSDEHVTGLIDNGTGEVIEDNNIPTVDLVDSNQLLDEEGLNFGQGEWHDISSPEAYKNSVIGKCIDLDGKWGSQCVDGFADFNYQYTGRWLSTCGTGSAKGLWDCSETNAGDDYQLITNPTELQTGDWIVFDGGKYGHVGMAMGTYNNGYIALLGENQGGEPCEDGGSAFNIINISLATFKGAFRPKIYIKPEPTPLPDPEEIPISGCKDWWVEYGDTMSKIMLDCEGTIHYGEPMNQYAKSWYSTIIKPNQSVYEGWNSPSGVGLYADDLIEHRMK